jgi:hypothetical protein
MINTSTSPTTIEELRQQNAELEQQNAELKAKLTWFKEQFRLSQQKRFGASSERTSSDQLELFNEADPSVPATIGERSKAEIGVSRSRFVLFSTE